MYSETSSKIHGNDVFVRFERTDIVQIRKITFNYNRFSTLTIDSLKAVGRFRIQLLLQDNAWSTRYSIPKNDRYSNTSTQWTKFSLNFTEKIMVIKYIMMKLILLMLLCV